MSDRNVDDGFGEFLRQVYWELGYSTHALAMHLGTNQPTICRLMDAYGILRRSHQSRIPHQAVYDLLEKMESLGRRERGQEVKNTAKSYGVNRGEVYRRLRLLSAA